jgi:hypothetical protein
MRTPINILELHEIITQFGISLTKVGALMGGSGLAFWMANSLPEELSVPKDASMISGWVLAITTIATLWKVCFKLFSKLEERDAVILKLHEANTKREETEADHLRKELEKEREKNHR